jgi:hypothetical protein
MLDNDYDYDNDNEPPRDFCTAPLVMRLQERYFRPALASNPSKRPATSVPPRAPRACVP